jgi:hypothetical protein
MDNFPESVLPFLILAVFVGFRIVFMLRRQRNRRGRETDAPAVAATQKPARGFVPWEEEFRDDAAAGNAAAQTGDGDEAFSAWNLSVDDEPPVPAVPPTLPRERTPGPLAPAGPSRFPETPGPDCSASVLADPPGAPAAPGPEPSLPAGSAADPLEARFRGLPFLQRGLVWAELLGAPRGLD